MRQLYVTANYYNTAVGATSAGYLALINNGAVYPNFAGTTNNFSLDGISGISTDERSRLSIASERTRREESGIRSMGDT